MELPEALWDEEQLTHLCLDGNRLGELGLPTGIPLCLPHLRRLEAARNGLRALPAALCELAALQSLRLGHNAFVELPAEIGRLGALTELDASHNQLCR